VCIVCVMLRGQIDDLDQRRLYIYNMCNQTCMYMYVFIACDVEGENGWS